MTSHIPTSFQDGFRTEFRPSSLGLLFLCVILWDVGDNKGTPRLDIGTFRSANTKRKLN